MGLAAPPTVVAAVQPPGGGLLWGLGSGRWRAGGSGVHGQDVFQGATAADLPQKTGWARRVDFSGFLVYELAEMARPMVVFASIAASLALLVGLSVPAQAARCTAEQAPAEQAAVDGETQVAGFLMTE